MLASRTGFLMTAAAIHPLWFLPTFGDGRHLGSPESSRAGDFPYLKQIAQAADTLGFEGVLIPTGRSCDDSWLLASALAPSPNECAFWSPSSSPATRIWRKPIEPVHSSCRVFPANGPPVP